MTTKEFKTQQKRKSTIRLKTSYPKELTIVAEGDSWFDYPFRKDIIDYLIDMGYAIDNKACRGDTLENMVFGSFYHKKGDIVTHKGAESLQVTLSAVRVHKPHFVLFSAGGNDIVGGEIRSYLNHKHGSPTELINKDIFKSKLKNMVSTIEFFIEAIHNTSADTQIIMDGYDYAKPNGKGYRFILPGIDLAGPWILPSMGSKAITLRSDQDSIIKYFVDEFNTALQKLDNKFTYFHHLDLRGLFPRDNEWHNEIHLNNTGFKKVAKLYHNKITSILNHDPIEVFEDKIIA